MTNLPPNQLPSGPDPADSQQGPAAPTPDASAQQPAAYPTQLPPADPSAAGPTLGAPPRAPSPPPGGYRPPPGSVPPIQPGTPAASAPQPRKRGSSGGLTCLIIVVVLIVVVLGGFALIAAAVRSAGPTTTSTWPGTSGDAVGVIRVSGLITGTGQISPLFGSTAGSETITSHFRAAAKDRSVRALVVRINSPGGSAAASQEIYQAVQQYREETDRKVIVSMADVAASGGYYIAAPADKIMALPATMTGSIGVLMETIEYHGLMGKIGVEGNTLTSGRYKDMGSPFRAMRPDERQLFQAMIDDVYDQFVTAVAEGRGMDKAEVKKLADGRAFTGRQAKEVGLVDELGTFRDAIKLAAEEAGIKGEPTVKFFGQVTLFDALFGQVRSRASQTFPPGLLFDARLWPVGQMLVADQPIPALE